MECLGWSVGAQTQIFCSSPLNMLIQPWYWYRSRWLRRGQDASTLRRSFRCQVGRSWPLQLNHTEIHGRDTDTKTASNNRKKRCWGHSQSVRTNCRAKALELIGIAVCCSSRPQMGHEPASCGWRIDFLFRILPCNKIRCHVQSSSRNRNRWQTYHRKVISVHLDD